MNQIIVSVFLTYYLILLGLSFFVFLNLIIITARVYKLRLAEVNFLSCYTLADGIMISVRSMQRSEGDVSVCVFSTFLVCVVNVIFLPLQRVL